MLIAYIDVVYFMGLYIYHQRPTLCHKVERHYHGSLYFIFPFMNLVLNCRTHTVNTQGY